MIPFRVIIKNKAGGMNKPSVTFKMSHGCPINEKKNYFGFSVTVLFFHRIPHDASLGGLRVSIFNAFEGDLCVLKRLFRREPFKKEFIFNYSKPNPKA